MLASGSPRRKQLLAELGYEFVTKVKPTDEKLPEGVGPAEAAEIIAGKKISQFSDEAQTFLVIAADTIVAAGNSILGKPENAFEAIHMLRQLSGRSHDVITGVAMQHKGKLLVFHSRTEVFFRELTEAEMEYYVRHYRPFDKAGAYGIQEWIGLTGIERINGDYYNVMGLPAARVYREIEEWGGRGV